MTAEVNVCGIDEIPIRQLNILLLEYVVDNVAIDEQVKMLIDGYIDGFVCIAFKLLNFPPFEICEDVLPGGMYSSIPIFKSGRSGIFSIPDMPCAEEKLIKLDIRANLKFPGGGWPEIIPLGDTSVDITKEITGIMFESKIDPGRVPVSRTIRQTYSLIGSNNKLVGFISLFLRMSCFREMIVQKVALCNTPPIPLYCCEQAFQYAQEHGEEVQPTYPPTLPTCIEVKEI